MHGDRLDPLETIDTGEDRGTGSPAPGYPSRDFSHGASILSLLMFQALWLIVLRMIVFLWRR